MCKVAARLQAGHRTIGHAQNSIGKPIFYTVLPPTSFAGRAAEGSAKKDGAGAAAAEARTYLLKPAAGNGRPQWLRAFRSATTCVRGISIRAPIRAPPSCSGQIRHDRTGQRSRSILPERTTDVLPNPESFKSYQQKASGTARRLQRAKGSQLHRPDPPARYTIRRTEERATRKRLGDASKTTPTLDRVAPTLS